MEAQAHTHHRRRGHGQHQASVPSSKVAAPQRALQAVAHASQHVSAHAASIWSAVRQAEPKDSYMGTIFDRLATYKDIAGCCNMVHRLYDIAAGEARAFRRDRWHTWCNDT